MFSKRKNIFHPESRDVSSANPSGFNLQAVLLSVTWEQLVTGTFPALASKSCDAGSAEPQTHGLSGLPANEDSVADKEPQISPPATFLLLFSILPRSYERLE